MTHPELRATYLGSATVLLEIGPLHLLTDPVLDPAGKSYVTGPVTLQKTDAPVLSPESLPRIDAVLLSHDEHADNVDERARAWLPNAERILTTTAAAERLGGKAKGLRPWESATVERDGIKVRVTGMPAQHGPDGTEHISGLVTGFLLEWNGAGRRRQTSRLRSRANALALGTGSAPMTRGTAQ